MENTIEFQKQNIMELELAKKKIIRKNWNFEK